MEFIILEPGVMGVPTGVRNPITLTLPLRGWCVLGHPSPTLAATHGEGRPNAKGAADPRGPGRLNLVPRLID